MGDAAYNYGYNDPGTSITVNNARYDGSPVTLGDGKLTGEGARTLMEATPADAFMDFTPEQQGQIVMHYFTRRVLLGRPQTDYAPWEKFVTFVQTHPQVA
jgi:hypothetical protein